MSENEQHIEDAVFGDGLPINSIPVIARLNELMKEAPSSNIDLAAQKDPRIHQCFWLLCAQFAGSIGIIDLHAEWIKIHDKHKEKE